MMLRLSSLLLVALPLQVGAQPAKPPNADGKIDGRGIAEAAESRKEAREKASDELARQLAALPNVLTAKARKPTGSDYDEEKGVLTLDLTICVTADKWKAYAKGFVAAADKACLFKGTATMLAKPKASGGITFYEAAVEGVLASSSQRKPKTWSLWVLTGANRDNTQTHWSYFIVDCPLPWTLGAQFPGTPVVQVELLDKVGAKIKTVSDRGTAPVLWPWLVRKGFDIEAARNQMPSPVTSLLIAPFALGSGGGKSDDTTYQASLDYATQEVRQVKVKLTTKELARLSEIKCAVEFRKR
jgi:hypothetical protein